MKINFFLYQLFLILVLNAAEEGVPNEICATPSGAQESVEPGHNPDVIPDEIVNPLADINFGNLNDVKNYLQLYRGDHKFFSNYVLYSLNNEQSDFIISHYPIDYLIKYIPNADVVNQILRKKVQQKNSYINFIKFIPALQCILIEKEKFHLNGFNQPINVRKIYALVIINVPEEFKNLSQSQLSCLQIIKQKYYCDSAYLQKHDYDIFLSIFSPEQIEYFTKYYHIKQESTCTIL